MISETQPDEDFNYKIKNSVQMLKDKIIRSKLESIDERVDFISEVNINEYSNKRLKKDFFCYRGSENRALTLENKNSINRLSPINPQNSACDRFHNLSYQNFNLSLLSNNNKYHELLNENIVVKNELMNVKMHLENYKRKISDEKQENLFDKNMKENKITMYEKELSFCESENHRLEKEYNINSCQERLITDNTFKSERLDKIEKIVNNDEVNDLKKKYIKRIFNITKDNKRRNNAILEIVEKIQKHIFDYREENSENDNFGYLLENLKSIMKGSEDNTTISNRNLEDEYVDRSFENLNEVFDDIQGLDALTNDILNLKVDNKKLVLEIKMMNKALKSKIKS